MPPTYLRLANITELDDELLQTRRKVVVGGDVEGVVGEEQHNRLRVRMITVTISRQKKEPLVRQ